MDDVLQVETDPVILRRYFPVEATIDGELVRPALVIVTRERVYVWRTPDELLVSAAYDPAQMDELPLPREYELRVRPLIVDTPDGRLAVNKARGCGCGNPLKSFRPFTPQRSGRS